MKNVFKQLIVDFQEQEIPLPTKREIAPLEMPKEMRKAFVLTGMRRSGKTWTLYQHMRHLRAEGIDRRQILYLNFEDDRLLGVSLKDMHSIIEAYFELFPQLVDNKSIHFFFDEIHEVPGWEKFIRRILDNETMQIYLTGSSAKMLSKEIATSLRGRTLVREIYPYNFREFLTHLHIDFDAPLPTKKKASLNHYMHKYLQYGGFPEVVGLDSALHREILQGYVDTVIFRDIVERYNVKNVHVLRKLLTHCLQNPASSFSVNKMYQMFKSLGYAISKNSLYEFMDYFEDAYCLFSVPSFNLSARKSQLKPCKIYPVDTGLISAYVVEKEFMQGPALDSLVFTSLKRVTKNLYYFSTARGLEVDFFAEFPDNSKKLFQVSLSLKQESTRKRELTALKEAMQEIGLTESFIITLEEEETVICEEGTIYVLPLISYLLES